MKKIPKGWCVCSNLSEFSFYRKEYRIKYWNVDFQCNLEWFSKCLPMRSLPPAPIFKSTRRRSELVTNRIKKREYGLNKLQKTM